jgi:hypothetical protein
LGYDHVGVTVRQAADATTRYQQTIYHHHKIYYPKLKLNQHHP